MKLTTHIKAAEILALLRGRIESGNLEPISNYCAVGAAIGWKGGADYGPTVGQATSVLDHACFVSGLPMLAFHYVRVKDGRHNPRAWQGIWNQFLPEVKEIGQNHAWSSADFEKVEKALANLPEEGVQRLNREAVKKGSAFIRYNLHRAVISKV